jgi:FkbM family methyltransferase
MDKESALAFEYFTFRSDEMVEEMKVFLEKSAGKKCFMDIGSLYGVFSLGFAAINPESKAIAVEPSAKPFEILNNNMKLNPEYNIDAHNVAIGSSKGKIKMKYEWQHLVAIGENEEVDKFEEINVEALDEFVKTCGVTPDIIKIDTEGYEYDVLLGGQEFLKAHKPVIMLEVHVSYFLKHHNITSKQLVDLIYSIGYEVYDLKNQKLEDPEKYFEEHNNCRVYLQ